MNLSSFFLWWLTTRFHKLPTERHSYDYKQNEQYENNSGGTITTTVSNTSTSSNTHLCHPPSDGMLSVKSDERQYYPMGRVYNLIGFLA